MAPTANFVDLCRICATETQSIVRHFIFEGEGKLRDLSKKIAACLPVKVKEDDRLPKVLCGECVYKLDLLHEFREKSQKTEAYLFTLIDGPADDHHVKKQSSSQLDDEDEDDDDSRGGDDGGHHDMDDDDDMERPVPPPPVRRNAQGQVCEPEVVIKIEEDTSQSKGDAAASTAASGSATQAETVQDNDEGGPSSSKRPRRAAANKRPIREDSPSLEAPSSPPPPKRRGRKPKGVTAAAATPGTSTSGLSSSPAIHHDFPVVCQQIPGNPWTQVPKFTLLNRPEITIEPEIVVKQEPPDELIESNSGQSGFHRHMFFPEPECILKVEAAAAAVKEKKITPDITIKPQITITKAKPDVIKEPVTVTIQPIQPAPHPARNVRGPWTPAKPQSKGWDANESDSGSNSRVYECQYCDEDFPTLDATVEHIAKKHPKGYNCNFCNEKFCTEQTLNQHKREKHWRESMELLNARKKPDSKDTDKEIKAAAVVQSIVRPPKKGKKFPCTYCRLTFEMQIHLDKHIEARHFEDTKLRELTRKVDAHTIKHILPQHSHLEPIRQALNNLRAHMTVPKAKVSEDEESLDGSYSDESDTEIIPPKRREDNRVLLVTDGGAQKTRGYKAQKR